MPAFLFTLPRLHSRISSRGQRGTFNQPAHVSAESRTRSVKEQGGSGTYVSLLGGGAGGCGEKGAGGHVESGDWSKPSSGRAASAPPRVATPVTAPRSKGEEAVVGWAESTAEAATVTRMVSGASMAYLRTWEEGAAAIVQFVG